MRPAAFVDTSLVVRYLTGQPARLAEAAARVIDANTEVVVLEIVLVETAYVLTSVYGVAREVVVDHLVDLVQKENVRVHGSEKAIAVQALLKCRPSGRTSFADAMIWSVARSSATPVVYTFDERFPAEGLELRGAG